MNKTKIKVLFILFPFLLSCLSTSPKEIDYPSEVLNQFENDYCIINLTYIPGSELEALFGKTGNIFGEYPALLMKRKTIVYKLSVTAKESDVKIDLRNIILTIGETSSQSKYKSQLLESWETYLNNEAKEAKASKLARDYMYNNNFVIEKNNSSTGLIVFLKQFPDSGAKSMRIGIEVDSENITEIEIPLVD